MWLLLPWPDAHTWPGFVPCQFRKQTTTFRDLLSALRTFLYETLPPLFDDMAVRTATRARECVRVAWTRSNMLC